VINENKHKLNVNKENHLIHHLIHEVVLVILHQVDHHREVLEDLIIIHHVVEDDPMDHSVSICSRFVDKM
jgi:hypothetical protein